MRLEKYFILLLTVGMMNVQAQKKKPVKIGFMGKELVDVESKAVGRFLLAQEGYRITHVQEDVLWKDNISNKDFTHIWIHQLGKNNVDYKDERTGEALRTFVKNGGNLILSMDAVRLLNDWGIEKNPFQIKSDTIMDNGFGRPLGFHAFKSHPIFEGMQGGAYPWKSNEDHVVRKIGFFGNQLPDTTIAKVLGVEWTYITFHEDNKLVLEYQLGKGKIIAVGAFSYFHKENKNTHELHRLYANVFEYMAGNFKSIEARSWDYSPQKITHIEQKFPEIDIPQATKWKLPEPTISLEKQKASEDMVIMTGRRMMLMSQQKGGIEEIWSNPFMALRDITTGILLKGSDEIIWLNDVTPSISSSPELLIREYTLGQTLLKEIITVSMDKPIGVIHYEWGGDELSEIYMKYTSNFRFMWPYSERVSSSIGYKWAPEINAAVATAQSNELVSMMGFSSTPKTSLMGQFEGFDIKNNTLEGIKTDLKQVSGFFRFDAQKTNGKLSAYMLAGEKGLEKILETYKEESKMFNQLFKKTSNYYSDFLDTKLMLTTPDEKFNTGYKWALVRSDQFFQETPDIGTTMVAGFGTTARGWNGGHKVSGRPGYAWYFGRDAQWCGFAVNAYGGHKQVKKMLEVFAKYQNLNGKIFHEMTTSGAVHFDASDSTPLYVALAAHYLKYSGDIAFIEKIWPSLKKAMDFCYSTDTDSDGLIEITNVGHGWVEGGSLFGTHTEVYLAGCWAAALDAASFMAEIIKEHDLAKSYKRDADNVKKIIDQDFWDKEGEYFYVGKMLDGSFMEEESVLTGVPIYFDAVLDAEKAYKTASAYATNEYSTDWGMRILPESSQKFNPVSYHSGMVWPLYGGWAALAEYKTGNFASGFNHIMNNLLVYEDWNLGSVEETLNGSSYTPAGVCSQQGWSETMVLQPIYEGMLGLKLNALNHSISLSPSFPWNWDEVKVDNITFGEHNIGFELTRTEKYTKYDFKGAGEQAVTLSFVANLPLGTVIKEVKLNGTSINYGISSNTESIVLQIESFKIKNPTSLEIVHRKGIGAIPIINRPKIGDTNKGAKIIGQELSGNRFDVVLEGLPGSTYQFQVMSHAKIKKIENGHLLNKESNMNTLEVTLPSSSKKYKQQKVSFYLK